MKKVLFSLIMLTTVLNSVFADTKTNNSAKIRPLAEMPVSEIETVLKEIATGLGSRYFKFRPNITKKELLDAIETLRELETSIGS